MLLIVGLGNPGFEYQNTRHNAGFLFIDAVAKALGAPPFTYKKDLVAEISKVNSYLLLKPQTFMNESGKAVRATITFYKELAGSFPTNCIVAHDDLDIPLGSFKLQRGKGPKVHNGISSVEQYLQEEQFWRVRLGVDGRQGDRTIPGKNYVLQAFPLTERAILERVITEQAIPQCLQQFSSKAQ